MLSGPLVSVMVPAFNAECFVERAVRSALGQTERSLEVIVVDDGSTDRTADIVARLAAADPRVRLLRHADNRGAPAAANTAMVAAVGRWAAILDADDWYAPTRVRRLIDVAEAKNARVIADNQWFFLEGRSRPWRKLIASPDPGILALSAIEFVRGDQPGRIDNLGLLKPVFRLDLARRDSIWYDEDVPSSYDFYFLLSMIADGSRLYVVNEPLYHYVIRRDSLCRSPSERFQLADGQAARRQAIRLRERGRAETAELLEHRSKALESSALYKRFVSFLLTRPLRFFQACRLLRTAGAWRVVLAGLAGSLRVRLAFALGRLR